MNNLKDIVPIQQERDLKELGFNFENEHCYLKQKLGLFQVEEPYNSFDLILFSQAFRFIREKYKILHTINIDLSNNLKDHVYVYTLEDHLGSIVDRSEEYNTYEEAELACLKQLIEICKNK
jgi:hypothetical protein